MDERAERLAQEPVPYENYEAVLQHAADLLARVKRVERERDEARRALERCARYIMGDLTEELSPSYFIEHVIEPALAGGRTSPEPEPSAEEVAATKTLMMREWDRQVAQGVAAPPPSQEQ